MLTASPASCGMDLFPPGETGVVTELDDTGELLADVEPVTLVDALVDTLVDTLVAGADPAQALRAPAASIASRKIRAKSGLCLVMRSPTAS